MQVVLGTQGATRSSSSSLCFILTASQIDHVQEKIASSFTGSQAFFRGMMYRFSKGGKDLEIACMR